MGELKKVLIKKGLIAAVFLLGAVLFEIITFSYIAGALPRYFLVEMLYMLVVASIIFIMPLPALSALLCFGVLVFQGIFSYININLFLKYGDFFTFDLFAYKADFGGAMRFSDFHMTSIIWLSLTGAGVIAALFCILRFIKAKVDFKRGVVSAHVYFTLACALVFPLLFGIGVSSLEVDTDPVYIIGRDDKSLYSRLTHKNAFFYKFGFYPFYFKNGILSRPFGEPIDAIDAEALTAYFSEGTRPEANAYTGLSKEDNLIVVMLESLDFFMLDEKYTPTLYAALSGGITLHNFHNQAKTDYAEASVILGSYPSDNKYNLVTAWRDAAENAAENGRAVSEYYAYALPHMLKRNGFDTANYFHLNDGTFYSRNVTHGDFGFDNSYFPKDERYYDRFWDGSAAYAYPAARLPRPQYEPYDYVSNWALPEAWFLYDHIDEFMPKSKRFFSFLTTIHAHGCYDLDRLTPLTAAYYRSIDDRDLTHVDDAVLTEYKVALSMAMVLDDGLRYMLDELKARTLTEKTTILFYADHNAYMNSLAYHMRDSGLTEPRTFHIPAAILSPAAGRVSVDKFTTAFDLTPTLLNLLGIDYNQKLYLGHDVFSADTSVVISKIGGVFNDKYYTYDMVEVLGKAEDATAADFIDYQNGYLSLHEHWKYVTMLYEESLTLQILDEVRLN